MLASHDGHYEVCSEVWTEDAMAQRTTRPPLTKHGTPRKPRTKAEGAHNKGWEKLKPFKSREENGGVIDPRINVRGAKAHNRAELSKAIEAYLNAEDLEGTTNLDLLIDKMAHDGMPLDRKTLIEYFAGKLPQPIQQRFEGALTVKFVDETEGGDAIEMDAGVAAVTLVNPTDQAIALINDEDEGGTDDDDGPDPAPEATP